MAPPEGCLTKRLLQLGFSILLFLVLFLLPGGRGTLVRHHVSSAAAKSAICNDGSPAGYYMYRNTSSTKWIVHLQGGGFCTSGSTKSCARRKDSNFGSSRNWKCALPNPSTSPEEDIAATVSSASRRNPYFLLWNRVYVPYCSSDLWLGQNANTTENPAGVSMAGHFIIVAVLSELLKDRGMNMATEVVFGGSSAGVLTHLEDAAITVKTATRQTTGEAAFVAGYSDGWTPFYPTMEEFATNPSVTPETSPSSARRVQDMATLYRGYLPGSCRDVYSASRAPFYGYQCTDARWGARAVSQTPLIVLAARWDTRAIFNSFGSERYTCAHASRTLTGAEATFINQLGQYSYGHTQNISRYTSLFYTNCYAHSFVGGDAPCSGVNSTAAYSALVSFLGTSKRNQRVLVRHAPPLPATPLACGARCGAPQCAWGMAGTVGQAANCSSAGVGLTADPFGELCAVPTPSRQAPSDTFNGEAIRFDVVNATERKAVCLDDTPAVYYVARNTSSDKWAIFLRGGSFCRSPAGCKSRAKGHLGTSKNYACTLPAREPNTSEAETLPQPLNADPDVNPFFYQWNRVFIRYCSGDLYLGTVTRSEFNFFGVSTAGHHILTATIDDLLSSHGLDRARTVVFGGSSAGSIGSIAHLDLVSKMINKETRGVTKVIGVGDSGWFRAFPSEAEFSVQHMQFTHSSVERSKFISGIKLLMSMMYGAYISPRCRAARKKVWPALGGYDCIDAASAFPHLRTPAIMLTNRWDTFDLAIKMSRKHYVCASVAGSLDARSRAYVSKYGQESYRRVNRFRSATTAIYMTNCYKHTSFTIGKLQAGDPVLAGAPCGRDVHGITPYQATVAFVQGAMNDEANLDRYSSIDPPPADALQLQCTHGCGAKQCSWATNFSGNAYNYTTKLCPPQNAISFDTSGIARGYPHCNANVTLAVLDVTESKSEHSHHGRGCTHHSSAYFHHNSGHHNSEHAHHNSEHTHQGSGYSHHDSRRTHHGRTLPRCFTARTCAQLWRALLHLRDRPNE